MQSGQQGGGEGKVTISGFAYDPAVLTVKAGTEVSWSNSDDILHTVTAGTNEAPEAENFDGQLDGKGTTFKKVFEEAGTFQYFCTKHKLAMKGEVKVT
ncbi:MAG TPA: plastocyanin/azurin family copper-binding protein [Actinomycetota bacterium]|nr:plastocyanin/azurin family copper-binding protein [Actinomycetota bacterium]